MAPVVKLTRIYTRTGDDGSTVLGDFSRTHKNDPRLIAYAETDETNVAIGVALALGGLHPAMCQPLERIQQELFDVGADLCTPLPVAGTRADRDPARVGTDLIDVLEADCDRFNARLDALPSFVLPGGTPGAALLHGARTSARRAERAAWAAIDEHGASVNPLTAQYLNRLSDLLFILARCANEGHGERLWERKPEGPRDDRS